jgi:hypothetical protein
MTTVLDRYALKRPTPTAIKSDTQNRHRERAIQVHGCTQLASTAEEMSRGQQLHRSEI